MLLKRAALSTSRGSRCVPPPPGSNPAPETLGFVPMLGTPTETRICSPTLRWVDEAVDGWFERAGRRGARIDRGGVEPAGWDARDELLGDAGGSLAPEDPVSEQATAVRQGRQEEEGAAIGSRAQSASDIGGHCDVLRPQSVRRARGREDSG
jgi:hypothetical protein